MVKKVKRGPEVPEAVGRDIEKSILTSALSHGLRVATETPTPPQWHRETRKQQPILLSEHPC